MDLTRSAGRVVACLVSLIFLAGCRTYPQSASAPELPPSRWLERAIERWPDSSYAELSSGRQTFVESCSRCHGLPEVTYLTEDEWPTTMLRMQRYAKLDEARGRAVLRYVLTARGEIFGHRSAFDRTDRMDSGIAAPGGPMSAPGAPEAPPPGPASVPPWQPSPPTSYSDTDRIEAPAASTSPPP